jgi:hypothetical protein
MAYPLRQLPQPTTRRGRIMARLRAAGQRLRVPVPVKRLADYPLTIAGAGVIDWGVCTVSITAGIILGGLALMGLEYLIADEE